MTDLRAKIERADLIAKLEAAEAGSRKLDHAIHAAVGSPGSDDPRYFAFLHGDYPPCYTTSLDAALTLVPEGLYWIVGHGKTSPNELPFGAIISTSLPRHEERGTAEHNASAALALCIASLKAREADRLKEEK